MAQKPLPSVAITALDAPDTSRRRRRILLAALSAVVLIVVMGGCVIFKSVTSSQLNVIGNVTITTTACASDVASNNSGYNPPDSACQGAGKGGNTNADAADTTTSPSFGHVTTGLKTNTTTTDPTFSYTINNGVDRLLVVKVVENATTDNIAGITYGGTALTALSEYAPGAGRWANHVFYLKNPPTGAANVAIDITSGVKLTVAMEQYDNVNQTSTFGTVATASNQAGSTAPTVNVSGATNDMVTDSLAVVSDTAIPTVATPSPQVEDYEINTGATTTDVVGAGSHRASAGASTTMSHTLSASRPWSTVSFAIKPGQYANQYKMAYRIPSSVTAPNSFVSTVPSGGSALTFTQSSSYSSQLTSLSPPGSGKKWVGYLSNAVAYSNSGNQYITVAPGFPLPQGADGSPFQTPFNYQVVVGFRDVDESTPGSTSSRTVSCGSDAFALYADGASGAAMRGVCVDNPTSSTLTSDLSQATRDLGLIAGSPQAADAGTTAAVPFTAQWNGAGAIWGAYLTASTNIPGATATPTPDITGAQGGGHADAVDVSVPIPPGTTPGTYNVTLTATGASGGEVRQQVNTVTVGEAFGLSPAPDIPLLGTINLNAQAQTQNATMSNFGVIDSPGSSDQGWNVTIVGDTSGGKPGKFAQYCPGPGACGSTPAGQYVSSGYQLLNGSLNLNTSSGSWSGGTGTAPTFECNAVVCPIDAASVTKIAKAPNGGGTALWSASGFNSSSLALSTPSTLRALPASEVYHLHAVWTLNSGP